MTDPRFDMHHSTTRMIRPNSSHNVYLWTADVWKMCAIKLQICKICCLWSVSPWQKQWRTQSMRLSLPERFATRTCGGIFACAAAWMSIPGSCIWIYMLLKTVYRLFAFLRKTPLVKTNPATRIVSPLGLIFSPFGRVFSPLQNEGPHQYHKERRLHRKSPSSCAKIISEAKSR